MRCRAQTFRNSDHLGGRGGENPGQIAGRTSHSGIASPTKKFRVRWEKCSGSFSRVFKRFFCLFKHNVIEILSNLRVLGGGGSPAHDGAVRDLSPPPRTFGGKLCPGFSTPWGGKGPGSSWCSDLMMWPRWQDHWLRSRLLACLAET